MATTATALYPSTGLFPNTNVYPGQGGLPMLRVYYTTEDAADTDPLWIDATSKVLSFSVSRGRDTELSEVDAGTATITLDNRTRVFDPANNAAIRPMNRWRIFEEFTGEIQHVFVGYADSYEQRWPAPVGDAITIVNCTDEFKALAADRLPVTSPPRDSYQELVASDTPAGYWRFQDPTLSGTGGTWQVSGGYTIEQATFLSDPIVGDPDNSVLFMSAGGSTSLLFTEPAVFDTAGSSKLTVEFWLNVSTLPSGTSVFVEGATGADLGSGVHRIFWFELTSAGVLAFKAHNNLNTLHTVTAPTALATNRWYYIVGALDGSNMRLFVDTVNVATTAFASVLRGGGNLDDSGTFPPSIRAADGIAYYLDEYAWYKATYLGTARIGAHYQAARERGFPVQSANSRIGGILDAAGSHAPRTFSPSSTRNLSQTFMAGKPPLELIGQTVPAEAPEGVFFADRSGGVTFLGAGHRTVSPWNTVQATFDDDGTDLPYLDLDLDYSEAFLTNEWHLTRERAGGVTQTASDATSISRHGRKARAVSDIPILDDTTVGTIATQLLAAYKDPFTRITTLQLTTADPAVAEAALRRDIGDRIRVFRTPPGGGARIGQTLFIQKIEISGANDGVPWRIRWGVSPL